MARPSGSTLTATPRRGEKLIRSVMASRSARKPSSKLRAIVYTPAVLHEARELGAINALLGYDLAVGGALGQRAVETHDVEPRADAGAVKAGALQVHAQLEDVLPPLPAVLGDREGSDHLQTADVTFLAVEEGAALGLRRVDHRPFTFGALIDFEQAPGHRGFEHHPVVEDQAIDDPRGEALLLELRRRLRRAERRERRIADPAGEVDDAAGQRVP